MSNQPKMSRPPCSTSADPLLKTSDLHQRMSVMAQFNGVPAGGSSSAMSAVRAEGGEEEDERDV